MECGSACSRFPFRSFLRIRTASAFALLLLGLTVRTAQAQARVTVSGVVRDVSGGVVAAATVEALVGDRVISRATTGADGAYALAIPSRTPFVLRTHRTGFADDVSELDGASSGVSRDVTLAVGTMSDTLVVTASRVPESRTAVTQSLSVMARADIQALGSTELSDVLRFVPGTSVEGTGREGGGPTSLFVRGGDSDYNVVLIDGVRANLDGGRFDFSRVAAGEIERVEVLRGAQSSLWGADAMTSVVQIVTKRASPTGAPEASGSFEAGSFGTFRGNAGVYGGAGGRIDYRAAVTGRRTDGAFSDILPEDDRYTADGIRQRRRRRDRLVGLGSCGPALQRWRWQDSRTDHLWRERYGHGLPDARPDCVRYGLSHTRVPLHRQRKRQLFPLSRPFRRQHRRSLFHLCDPRRHPQRALSERNTPGPPARCSGVQHARGRRRTAGPGAVPGVGADLRFSVEPADRSHAVSPARGAIPGRLQLERQPAPERRI